MAEATPATTTPERRREIALHPTGVWAEGGTKVRISGRIPGIGRVRKEDDHWPRDVPAWDPTRT